MAGKKLAIKRKCGRHESPAGQNKESEGRLHCICPVGWNQRFCRAAGKKLFEAAKKDTLPWYAMRRLSLAALAMADYLVQVPRVLGQAYEFPIPMANCTVAVMFPA